MKKKTWEKIFKEKKLIVNFYYALKMLIGLLSKCNFK